MDPFRKVRSLFLQSIYAQCTIITALTALTIKTHPTEPTLVESKHHTLVYSHMDHVQAIWSLLAIVAGPIFLLVTSPRPYISPISTAHLHSNPYISWHREASAPIWWLLWSSHIGLSHKPPSTHGSIQEGPQLIFTIYSCTMRNMHNYHCAHSFNHQNSSYRTNLGRK